MSKVKPGTFLCFDRIDDFALTTKVLNCSAETTKRYGEIKNRLKDKGKPIPENDIWIAALAKQYDLTLVTRDTHFNEIDKLKLEAW
ncbi:MAG: PIN domain-containing protein [Proteobacteria bacterium]|nr:PIN domain-containing protein [Pseudomonadota bacterium]